jgi:hypothetical protein
MNESANIPEKVGQHRERSFLLIRQASGLPSDADSNFSLCAKSWKLDEFREFRPKLDFSYLTGWAAGLGSAAPADTN